MDNDFIAQVPPNNIEAEQAVLACMMTDATCISAGIERLAAGDFYHRKHGIIFEAITSLNRRHTAVDLITLKDAMTATGELEAIGGFDYLIDLKGSIPTTEHIDYYAAIVADKARRRAFIRTAQQMAASAFDETTEDPIGDGLKALVNLDIKQGGRADWAKLGDIEQANFERMMDAADALAAGKPMTGLLETGLSEIDKTLVVGPGDVLVIAAKTGFGKTVLASNIAEHVASLDHGPVAMFTLEMSKEAMARRFTATATGIDTRRQIRGDLNENEWPAMSALLTKRRDLPLYIRDKANVTPSEMLAACRKLEAMERRPLKLVVVDYLTLADADGKAENETTRAAKVSRGLKLMAQDLGCVVIAVAQLNRGVDGRESKRPELKDLKQSGAIEQDASAVILIHREGHKEGEKVEAGAVEAIIAKNRHGSQGSGALWFDASRVRFKDATFSGSPDGYGGMPVYEDDPAGGWQGAPYVKVT